MGTATVYCYAGFDDERRRCLVSSWRREQYGERADVPRGRGGYPEPPESFDGQVVDLERRLEKILGKLALATRGITEDTLAACPR